MFFVTSVTPRDPLVRRFFADFFVGAGRRGVSGLPVE